MPAGEAPQKAAEPTRLTINDPISPEELARLNELELAQSGIARQNLYLDQEKIKLMGASKRISLETSEIYKRVLLERGLPEDMIVEIDHETGVIRKQQIPEG